LSRTRLVCVRVPLRLAGICVRMIVCAFLCVRVHTCLGVCHYMCDACVTYTHTCTHTCTHTYTYILPPMCTGRRTRSRALQHALSPLDEIGWQDCTFSLHLLRVRRRHSLHPRQHFTFPSLGPVQCLRTITNSCGKRFPLPED